MTQPSDFQPSQYNRRASDGAPGAPSGPSNSDLMEAIKELQSMMKVVHTAFPRNDLGEPDFSGHRADHVTRINAAKNVEGYKVKMTERALVGIVAVLFTLFATGAGEHLKRMVTGS